MARYFLTFIKPNGKELTFPEFKHYHDYYTSSIKIRSIACNIHQQYPDLKIICKCVNSGKHLDDQPIYKNVFIIPPRPE